MSDKKKTKEKNSDVKKPKKKSFLVRRLVPFAFMLLALVFMPTTLIVMVGMLPSIVAFYVDSDRRKMGAFSIAFMNISPVVAYVVLLWRESHDTTHALNMLMDPITLVVIYFACFIGWTLNKFIPPIVGEFVKRSGMKRLKHIEKEQKALLESWGEDVQSLP